MFTWMKTYRQLREARRLHMSLSLSTCLFRDGTIYFLAILILQILRLFFSMTAMTGSSAINTLILTLPQILIQRFLMNLRHISQPVELVSSSGAGADMPSFVRFGVPSNRIGNIGECLADSPRDDWSEEYMDDTENDDSPAQDGAAQASPLLRDQSLHREDSV
ncbi:hypothetical protein PsYK624_108520 [Phanerochaete sordida]|uniref:Uncharacterized protein n=1 Tax=Phanerochaete sordida TaxID=48140 RepID=A0A9P3GH32_9APHY|nr:hypothetical protein PsYK624_108520 [Phanerochaete sordida]